MNCRDLQKKVRDVVVGQDDALRTAALAHATQCEACSALLEAESRLASELKLLVTIHECEQAPVAVEQKLLAALRASEWHVTAQGLRWSIWAPVAAVVLLCLVTGYALLRSPHRPAPQKIEQAPSIAKAAMPPAPQPVANSTKPRRPRRAVHRPAPPKVEAQFVTAFFAVPYPEPLRPDEVQRILRVRMPQSALAGFGLPINEDTAQQTIDADLLVGEDNIARAVRLVGTWTPSPPSAPER